VPSPSLLRIERLNYAIGGIAVVIAALTQPRENALGVAVGVALTCLNFFVLRRLVARWSADAKAGKLANSQLLMLPKMIGLMALVVGALALLPIDAAAFTIGYSIFILSIVIETFYASLRAPAPETPQPSEHDPHG
jgi:hypothetical protein